MGSYLKLKQLLEDKESFALICHVDPDGDAVGSMIALGHSLRNQGKEVVYVCKDPIPPVFHFLTAGLDFQTEVGNKKYDGILLMDNGDFRRTGLTAELKEVKNGNTIIANIDHHPKNDLWKFASINYADPDASSSSEIVYKLLTGLGREIDSKIADCLLAGIFYDTGGFKHSNTTVEVLEIVADLLRHGAKIKKISDNLANTKSLPLLKLWGVALERLKTNRNYKISYSIITQLDIETTGAKEDDISGLVNLLNSVPESKATLLLYEADDSKIKGSLRTEKEDVDVAKLAQILGGGGHKKAAGFTIEGRIEKEGKGWIVT